MTAVDAVDVIVDLLRRGHAVRFQVRGDSMHPVIRDDDYVHVEPIASLHVGDVVLALAERGLTAHRVIGREGDMVLMRGDNAREADPPLPESRVIGRVSWVERDGKRRAVRREIGALRWLRRLRRRVR